MGDLTIFMGDLTIFMGDFNAKVDQDNTGFERVMGRHGCGTRNENGEHLVEFCGNNNLVIDGTIFSHKEIHKLTWISPGGRYKNQIDHIVINGKWRRSLQDVRVRRGADVGSDHHLVSSNIKLKLMKITPKCYIKIFDTGKLNDIKMEQDFKLELKNRFQILQNSDINEEGQINEHWQKVKDTFSKASERAIGFRKQVHKEWITPSTWKLIDARKDLKKRLCNTHSERKTKRAILNKGGTGVPRVKTTDLPQVTDILYYIMLYRVHHDTIWVRIHNVSCDRY